LQSGASGHFRTNPDSVPCKAADGIGGPSRFHFAPMGHFGTFWDIATHTDRSNPPQTPLARKESLAEPRQLTPKIKNLRFTSRANFFAAAA
jgi:hypothetical protein